MSGRIGGPSHSDRTMQFTWKRTLTVYSCACEQTEENANMLFVMSAMRSVQKHRRDHGVVSSVKMNWRSLVTMNYAICRYVLTSGGVLRIIWEVHIGLIVQKVVLSVRGCLMWGISEWGCFLSGKFVVSYFWSPGQVSWECGRLSIFGTWMDGGGLSIVMFCRKIVSVLPIVHSDSLAHCSQQIIHTIFCDLWGWALGEVNSQVILTDFRKIVSLFGSVCGVADCQPIGWALGA